MTVLTILIISIIAVMWIRVGVLYIRKRKAKDAYRKIEKDLHRLN